ncbi:glycosyltransferase family 4 protein [Novosphingobium fuchskuhlense]|uniref:glycosyltransferase family 4 protein n=1 Tax=Novosphingobium fuchskuhlense TaxID=1117702 RepID=UPI000A85A601|nr:glycosyltransferase family 4 protein [Novosphingobium fuchskuhlense]
MLTRSYPSADDLYQYPFVHRRVLAYRARGHDVAVFRFDPAGRESRHAFEGVDCETGGAAALRRAVAGFAPDVAALHGLSEMLWPAFAALDPQLPVCAWLHGTEIPGIQRGKLAWIADPAQRDEHEALLATRIAFWRGVLDPWPENLRIAFVSANSREVMRADLGAVLQDRRTTVLHNPIDAALFAAQQKTPEDRFSVLSIRPHHNEAYGNDLAVAAVLALRERPWFARLNFTFVGDGPLFAATMAPLRGLPNVTLRQCFVRQDEIARLHRAHGVFLVPTRLDTQGVSRDEAMASSLVPVTNAVYAVPEFVDSACAGLAQANDAAGLAHEIAAMVEDPALFQARSAAAAARVRAQSGDDVIIPRELAWMAGGSA